jgi:thiamine biosynthesis lipoprotein
LSSLRRARPLLGTLVEISAEGAARGLAAAVDGAFAAIERVQQLMSFHDPESDVSRLNRDAFRAPVEVDPQTWCVLARAREISEASHGAFDITVAPRLVEWGYLPSSPRALPPATPNRYRGIELLPEFRVRFLQPALIDLGGIAKGYAVDAGCRALEKDGVFDYVVNAGGDLRVGVSEAIVHVRHPGLPMNAFVPLRVRAAALATSARYFVESDGSEDLHPIVAPDTGAPAASRDSISVRAADCITADALTKVVAILGPRAAPILERLDAEALMLGECGGLRLLPTGVERAMGRVERGMQAAAPR